MPLQRHIRGHEPMHAQHGTNSNSQRRSMVSQHERQHDNNGSFKRQVSPRPPYLFTRVPDLLVQQPRQACAGQCSQRDRLHAGQHYSAGIHVHSCNNASPDKMTPSAGTRAVQALIFDIPRAGPHHITFKLDTC